MSTAKSNPNPLLLTVTPLLTKWDPAAGRSETVEYGTLNVYAVTKSGPDGEPTGVALSLLPDGKPTSKGGVTVESSAALPIPKGLPLSLVAGFRLGFGKTRKPVDVTARDGVTSGERPKPKRYAHWSGPVGSVEYVVDVQVSADPRKPEEWSLYLTGKPGQDVTPTGVDLAALASLVD